MPDAVRHRHATLAWMLSDHRVARGKLRRPTLRERRKAFAGVGRHEGLLPVQRFAVERLILWQVTEPEHGLLDGLQRRAAACHQATGALERGDEQGMCWDEHVHIP